LRLSPLQMYRTRSNDPHRNPNNPLPPNAYLIISTSTSPTGFTDILLSAGPWSAPTARSFGLPIPPVSNLPRHSTIVRPKEAGFEPCKETETVFAGLSARSIGLEAADAEESTAGAEKSGGYTQSIEFITRWVKLILKIIWLCVGRLMSVQTERGCLPSRGERALARST